MLFTASLLDYWKREVHDILWVIFGVSAIILIFFEVDYSEIFIQIGIAMIIVPIALLFWRFGVFGGADAFCLIVLAAIAPQLTLTDNFVTPITTLTNAAILSVILLAVNVIRNTISILNHNNIFEGFNESKFRKMCAIFLGYRSKNPKHSFSIEKIQGDAKKLDFSMHHAENTEFCKTPNSWVTPGIPYILYITIGFIIQLFFGDIAINFLSDIIIN